MKRIFFYWIIIIIVVVFTSCDQSFNQKKTSENLIKNSSFETGNQSPDNWESTSPDPQKKVSFIWEFDPDRKSKKIGIQSAVASIGAWQQPVDLEPDSHYQLSAFVKTSNITGQGLGASVFFPRFRWMKPLSTKATDNWAYLETDFLSAGLTKMDLMCSLGAYGLNSGAAYFDDIALIKHQDPATDPVNTIAFDWGKFQIRMDKRRGYLTSLKPDSDPINTPEFLGCFATLPYLNHSKDVFLGDVSLDVADEKGWQHISTSGEDVEHSIEKSPDKVSVTHKFGGSDPCLLLRSTWESSSKTSSINWTLMVSNISNRSIEVGSFELPLPWNNNYCLFDPHDKASQKLLYTRRVSEHKHIAGSASYILVCPMNGEPPMLLMSPGDTSTAFEFSYHNPDTIRERRRDPGHWIHGAWPGLSRVCLASKSTIERYDWKPWLNPHTSFSLSPGDSRQFTIKFNWIQHRKYLEEVLGSLNCLGIRLIPGPSVIINKPFIAIIHGAKTPVEVTGAETWNVLSVSSENSCIALEMILEKEGSHTIRVTDSEGKSGAMFITCLSDISNLMDRRSDFIMKHQIFKQTNHPLDGAILCYNNRSGNVLSDPADMWGSGGYEGGVTDAMYLALKNAYRPDQDQIEFLESYITGWLLGGIQDPDDYGVCWMVSRKERKERGYNYIHVLNLYEAMARGSTIWPDLYRKDPEYYLRLWFKTFEAFRKPTVRFQDLGLMGRGNLTVMPEFLKRYEMDTESQAVAEEIKMWGQYWCSDPPFPFGSELFYDNTGYESIFFYRDYIGERTLAEQTINVTKAGRGRAPCWFWNDSDQRWWDAVRTYPSYESFTDFGENCHHYMTGLNGYMLLEAYDRGYGSDEYGPIGYSGILNSWARVDKDGFAGMCYCPDPASDNFGLNQFTGDVGLGLWGNLKAGRCYAVADPFIGMTGYGCQVLEEKNENIHTVTIIPYNGLNNRIRYFPSNLSIDTEGPVVQKASYDVKYSTLEINLENLSEFRCNAQIAISGMPDNTYQFEFRSPSGSLKTKNQIRQDKHLMIINSDFEPKETAVLIIHSMQSP
ncbi:hypothetical protein JW979_00180 [bacterium]|nr:hypothetical protein [candidate division CSSED10-310 bacterium]